MSVAKRFWLIASIMLGAAAAPNAKAAGDLEKKLTIFSVSRNVDDICHVLTHQERATLDVVYSISLDEIPPEHRAEVEKTLESGKPSSVNCTDGPLVRIVRDLRPALADIAKNFPSQASKKNEDEEMERYIREQRQPELAKLPIGDIAWSQGCWSGDTDEWQIRLCVRADRGTAQVHATSKNGLARCSTAEGLARERDGDVYAMMFVKDNKCASGQRMVHVEFACSKVKADELQCVISAFEKGNTMFVAPNNKRPLSMGGLSVRKTI